MAISEDTGWLLYQRLGMSLHNCVTVERSMVLLLVSLKKFGGDANSPEELRQSQLDGVRWLFGLTAGQLKTEIQNHFIASQEAIESIALFLQFRNEFVHNVPADMPLAGDPDQLGIRFYQYCELVDAAGFGAMAKLATLRAPKARDEASFRIQTMMRFLEGTKLIAVESDTPNPTAFVPFLSFMRS